MRHSFATWALEGNEEKGIAPTPIPAVRDWMGHASVQETEGYLHRSKASHSKAVANLDAYVTARAARPLPTAAGVPHRSGPLLAPSVACEREPRNTTSGPGVSAPTRSVTPQYATTLRIRDVSS